MFQALRQLAVRVKKRNNNEKTFMLINKTKKRKIIGKVIVAKSWLGKLKGLMFESRENFGYALIFPLNSESKIAASIHMLFVFFPIDVIWLDSKKIVVDKVEKLQPFTFNCTPKKAASFIVELPVGCGKKISIGNKLEWKDKFI